MKANLGYDSASPGKVSRESAFSTDEDITSELTRETRNSAMSNEFGSLLSPLSSQSPVNLTKQIDLSPEVAKQEKSLSEQHFEDVKELHDEKAIPETGKTASQTNNHEITLKANINGQYRKDGLFTRL